MAALFCVTLLPSCEKSGEGDDGGPEDISKLTLEASVTDADYDGFTMLWTPGELCGHIEYAVLPSADAKGAYEAFEAGTLSGVESVATPSAEVVIPCEAIGPYTVLSRAVSAKGTKGEIVTTYATASPAAARLVTPPGRVVHDPFGLPRSSPFVPERPVIRRHTVKR